MIKSFIKSNPYLYNPTKFIYLRLLNVIDVFRYCFFGIFKDAGIASYSKMQKKEYAGYTKTFDDAKNLCVGNFEVHEEYPYEEYLLQHFEGKSRVALDFGCGVGRMMKRMLAHFDVVDGVDISRENLGHAKKYLSDAGIAQESYSTLLSSGVGVSGLNKTYDFIYSTIALQHICVFEVRKKICEDLFLALKTGGSCCFQMGFGWDNNTHWFDNNYVARTTNGAGDVSIPNSDHLDAITNDLKKIGFKDIKYEFKISPHPEHGDKYHPIWIFIHMKK